MAQLGGWKCLISGFSSTIAFKQESLVSPTAVSPLQLCLPYSCVSPTAVSPLQLCLPYSCVSPTAVSPLQLCLPYRRVSKADLNESSEVFEVALKSKAFTTPSNHLFTVSPALPLCKYFGLNKYARPLQPYLIFLSGLLQRLAKVL